MKKFSELHEGVVSTYRTFLFATQLAKKFENWEAYKLGLIDDQGNLIRQPRTKQEKAALTAYDNLIRKVKRFIHKFVPDNSAFNTLVTMYLIKQESQNQLRDEFEKNFSEDEINIIISKLYGISEGDLFEPGDVYLHRKIMQGGKKQKFPTTALEIGKHYTIRNNTEYLQKGQVIRIVEILDHGEKFKIEVENAKTLIVPKTDLEYALAY